MKIICIGRNYAEHAAEMNSDVPETPMIFMKPETALFSSSSHFILPDISEDVHYEVELVYKIDKEGKNISLAVAHQYYSKIALGIDFTARDLQSELKKNSHPWEIAKGWDNSAYVSRFIDLASLENDEILFQLMKNNQLVQDGSTGDMIHPIDKIISYSSKYFTLKAGDLIYTGTPSGVGPVTQGDVLTGTLMGEEMFMLKIQ